MWYKNKRTGKTWDITDQSILKRVAKSTDYEPVEEDEELPFVPDEELEEEPEIEQEAAEEKPEKKAGGRSGRTASKTKK